MGGGVALGFALDAPKRIDRLALIDERASRLIPNVRLEIIPDCGHLAPLDQPEAVTRALSDFLLQAQ